MIVTHKRNHSPCRRAFTILELIVAIAITVIMLFLINALFQATSTGVSMGMALSDVIGAGRAMGDQLERDTDLQFAPGKSPPGVLVILCQKISNVPYKQRGVERTRPVRTDQFLFTRDLGNSSNIFTSAPITPLDDTTFSSATKTQMAEARAIRIWYGHVLKTNEAGTAVTALGADGRNKFANEWALGRHALFLVGGTTAPGFNHAAGVQANAAVSSHVTKPGGGTASLFHGTTDVAYLNYSDPSGPVGTFLGASATAPGVGSANPNLTLWADDVKNTYDVKAMGLMFAGANRLWTNPFPRIAPTVTSTWVTAGQVAQMHPLLMDNISDFIVEFAADAVDDGNVDTMTADGFDGEPDRAGDEIIWYGLEANALTNSQGPPTWNTRGVAGLESPVVTSSLPVGVNVGYVFRHGAANKNVWPYMVRVRYRIHDTRALLEGDRSLEIGDGTNSGRWFEQIFIVKRD